MAYGQRDRFLQAVVTFTVSPEAKKLTPAERQDILVKIREIYAPNITNDDWGEIAQGISEFKQVIIESVESEVPVIDELVPHEEEPIDFTVEQSHTTSEEEAMNDDDEDDEDNDEQLEMQEKLENDDFESEEDDFEEPPREKEPEPPKVERQGKLIAPPKEVKQKPINMSRLKGLMKKKRS